MNTKKLLVLLMLAFAVVSCRASATVTVRTGHDGSSPQPRQDGRDTSATPAPPPEDNQTSSTASTEQGQGNATPAQPGRGSPCSSTDDCSEGLSCQGEAGCNTQWTCQPPRRCTRDLVPFCGCDGQVFRSSSTCPSRPYSKRGGCEETRTATPPPGHASTKAPVRPGQPASGLHCTSSSDCPGGQMCLGHEGCNTPATCVPSRPCTMDLVPFCGCDGQVFRGSSSCPAKNYVNRGGCRQSDGPVPDIESR